MYKQSFDVAHFFVHSQLGYGLGASPNEGGGNVRDLLAAAKAGLRLGLGTSL